MPLYLQSTVQNIMSEKELFDQLFNNGEAPPRRDEQKDLLSSLFAVQLPKPAQPNRKKKEEVHEYIRLAETGNDKTKKSVQKWKEEQTMTPEQIRQKRNFEKVTQQFEKTIKTPIVPPPSSSEVLSKKKIYMPNIIDPFEKKDNSKNEKIKPLPSTSIITQPPQKKEDNKQKEKQKAERELEQRQRLAKAQAKQEKIKRKEMELAAEKQRAIQREKAAAAIAAAAKAKQRQQRSQKIQEKPHKKASKKESSSSSSSSGSQGSSSPQEQELDWRKQLRSITKYNPSDQKFKKRDKQKIKQSGIDRMFGEDRFSSRMGKLEQEEDLRREMQMKHRKDKHHHSSSHGHHRHR